MITTTYKTARGMLARTDKSLTWWQRLRGSAPASLKRRYRVARNTVRLVRNVMYDAGRYQKFSGTCCVKQTPQQIDAEITKIYHAIEKGLSLPTPRPGFGRERIAALCDLLEARISDGGAWTRACANAVNALDGYAQFNAARHTPISPCVTRVLDLAHAHGFATDGSPTRSLLRTDVIAATCFDAQRFFWSRHSIRQFAPGPLDYAKVHRAIDMARSTPSVCNRQSGRVLIVSNTGSNFDLLRHQNGNAGFGHHAQAVLVVTSDLNCFLEPEERYQPWIDGGMFAMSLILALHAEGLGACCLNWSSDVRTDKAFRAAAELKDEENVIMLIAVGNLPETLSVANSERLTREEICRYVSL